MLELIIFDTVGNYVGEKNFPYYVPKTAQFKDETYGRSSFLQGRRD